LREIIDLLINFKEFFCVGEKGYKTSYDHKKIMNLIWML